MDEINSVGEEAGVERWYHIFDDALPNPIGLRRVIGAALGCQIYLTIVFALVGLLMRQPPLEALGLGIIWGGAVGRIVAIGLWFAPIASCICESIALRRITPGVLYKVTPALLATYGFAFTYGLYLLVRANPAVAGYIHAHGLESWRLYVTLALLGFVLAWMVRHALMWTCGKPLFVRKYLFPNVDAAAIGAVQQSEAVPAPQVK